MNIIRCTLALLVFELCSLRLVAADYSSPGYSHMLATAAEVRPTDTPEIAAEGLQKLEATKAQNAKFCQTEEVRLHKEMDQAITDRANSLKKLAQEKEKTVRDRLQAAVKQSDEYIARLDGFIQKLKTECFQADQDLTGKISRSMARLAKIKADQNRQPVAKTADSSGKDLKSPTASAALAAGAADNASAAPASAQQRSTSFSTGNSTVGNRVVEAASAQGNPTSAAALPANAIQGAAIQPNGKLTGEDRLTLDTLNEITEELGHTTEAEKRNPLLEEFLTKSEPFVKRQPDQMGVWATRAQAALELNRAETGWQAGQQLKRLGAMDSEEAKIRKVMAALNRKGWLEASFENVKGNQHAEADKLQEENKKKWIGTWKVKASQPTRFDFGNSHAIGSNSREYILSVSEDGNLSVKDENIAESDQIFSDGVSHSRHYRSFVIPGKNMGSFVSTGKFPSSDSSENGSNSIERIWYTHQGLVLHVGYTKTDNKGETARIEIVFALDSSRNRVVGPDFKINVNQSLGDTLRNLPENQTRNGEGNDLFPKINWLEKF